MCKCHNHFLRLTLTETFFPKQSRCFILTKISKVAPLKILRLLICISLPLQPPINRTIIRNQHKFQPNSHITAHKFPHMPEDRRSHNSLHDLTSIFYRPKWLSSQLECWWCLPGERLPKLRKDEETAHPSRRHSARNSRRRPMFSGFINFK